MEQQATALQQEVQAAADRLVIAAKRSELAELQIQSQKPDFWNDTGTAQEVMQTIAKLESQTAPWQKLLDGIRDLVELIGLGDATMHDELSTTLNNLTTEFESLKQDLLFTGQYDDHDVLVSLSAGAGGTDAQDWTGMLLRMYVRYAERSGLKCTMIEESPGEEAGLKSATFEIAGLHAYGKLKSEQGVHRLVRLSPFNSDNLRQTSFAKVEIAPKIATPDAVIIDEKELKIDVYRAGGHGGQSVNTTDSAVRITHMPTGITVAIQNERSQLQNKETALTILRSRLAQLQLEQHAEKVSELKGPNQSAEWGNQIRSYVLHPYKQVKDLRTRYETSDPGAVLDGELEPLIAAYLEQQLGEA